MSRSLRRPSVEPVAPGLQALGLGPAAEALYRALLGQPHATVANLAQLLQRPAAELQAELAAMQSRGLASASRRQPDGWEAAMPEVAVELLLMERQAELNRARAVLPELLRGLMRDRAEADGQDVHVVPPEPEAQLRAYLDLHHAARQTVAAIVCPPFVTAAPDAMEAARAQARLRGVRYRFLMAPEILQWPGWRDAARQSLDAGDEIRVAEHLPFKLLLCDRSAGLLPLRSDAPEGPALRLGPTAALDALWLLFESLWAGAMPALETAAANDPDEAELRTLVTLLASGANDKKIASVLGISERTLLRRINVLSTQLQARSRFQCGWQAARQWGGPLPDDGG